MNARLVRDAEHLRMEGELNFDSVMPLHDELKRFIAASKGKQVTLDLSGLTQVNSVGLSVLLMAARVAEANQVALQATGLPDGLLSMAAVCGLDDWLNTLSAATDSTMEIRNAGQ